MANLGCESYKSLQSKGLSNPSPIDTSLGVVYVFQRLSEMSKAIQETFGTPRSNLCKPMLVRILVFYPTDSIDFNTNVYNIFERHGGQKLDSANP